MGPSILASSRWVQNTISRDLKKFPSLTYLPGQRADHDLSPCPSGPPTLLPTHDLARPPVHKDLNHPSTQHEASTRGSVTEGALKCAAVHRRSSSYLPSAHSIDEFEASSSRPVDGSHPQQCNSKLDDKFSPLPPPKLVLVMFIRGKVWSRLQPKPPKRVATQLSRRLFGFPDYTDYIEYRGGYGATDTEFRFCVQVRGQKCEKYSEKLAIEPENYEGPLLDFNEEWATYWHGGNAS
ncbi:hypothetical protein EV360DRAFT_90289 [Lentinula raphanica]|nr:hypothetical protein EV360DRAFT_90289 [Lentinula raphanica]